MFVPCPHCGFLVALIVSRPDAAQRCPRCGQPLQLGDATADDVGGESPTPPPALEPETGPALERDPVEPIDDVPPVAGLPDATDRPGPAGVERIQPAGIDAPSAPGAPAPEAPPPVTDNAAAPAASAVATGTPPSAARPRRTPRAGRGSSAPSFARRSVSMFESGRRWPGVITVAVLLAVLALQLLLAQRHALAGEPGWRPTMIALCKVLRCELPPWREPEAFTMLARDVRPAADRDGVLQVEASFRNDARWPQPWPRLLLRLNDRHGRPVGERLLAPSEYLGQRASTPERVAPGQSASVRFAVREPAADVVAFDFDFR